MIFEYILNVILFQLAFLLIYELLLKKETFFNYNRLYLLLTPVIALLLPLLKLEFLVEAVPQNARINLPEIFIGQSNTPVETLPEVTITAEASRINWWMVTYVLGLGLSFILFLKKYQNLNRLFRFRKISEEKDFMIIEIPNSNIACTFFNTVFLGDQLSEIERNQILSHELVHVKQKHSFDLIFFEIMKIILWFNPLIYIYQSRIAGLHEFIADKEVLKTTEKKTYYEQLLNSAFSTQNISFINQFFNHSLIKKRIIMLQKNKSSQLSKFKFLLVIPLMLAMLTYVACSENVTEDDTDSSLSQYSYTLNKDEKMSSEKEAVHNKYEEFLFNNPDYVSWATIDYEAEKIQYSVHLRSEEVPEGYEKMEVSKKNGQEYTMYMSLYSPDKINISEKPLPPPPPGSAQDLSNRQYDNATSVPFAVIERVPAFPGCEEWEDDVRKNCTSSEISKFVNQNFDISLGKKLGLTGVNRVIVMFRIDETGNVTDIKSRAAHPELEVEAKRVIASLPNMIPGEQNGKPVSVMYSLPIAFKVGE